jgi:hypothetical protein
VLRKEEHRVARIHRALPPPVDPFNAIVDPRQRKRAVRHGLLIFGKAHVASMRPYDQILDSRWQPALVGHMRSSRRIACLVENNSPTIRAYKPTFNRLQKLLSITWPNARVIDIESEVCLLTNPGLTRKMDCRCNKPVGRAKQCCAIIRIRKG